MKTLMTTLMACGIALAQTPATKLPGSPSESRARRRARIC